MSEVLCYRLGTVATVGGALVPERIVAGPRATAGTDFLGWTAPSISTDCAGRAAPPEGLICCAAHRVAAARALGSPLINAHVVDIG